MKGRALVFGLNYAGTPAALNGCINDVVNIGKYIAATLRMPVKVCTDDVSSPETTAVGIVQNLYELAVQSHRDSLDFVWIHYSGHGSYVMDASGDDADGRDECLVPSDYAVAGVLTDDFLNKLFCNFSPSTRVVFVCDSCHSGTICDVKYNWESARRCRVENVLCSIRAKVLTLSGCRDDQTSADAYNIAGDAQFAGALTACMLKVLVETPLAKNDVFLLLARLTEKLASLGFSQRPRLCSTYNLAREPAFLPPV